MPRCGSVRSQRGARSGASIHTWPRAPTAAKLPPSSAQQAAVRASAVCKRACGSPERLKR